MSIFVDKNSRVVVQGITGREGQFHTRHCVAYGTRVVAGVTPGKAGQKMDDIPVFNTVKAAVMKPARTAVLFLYRRLLQRKQSWKLQMPESVLLWQLPREFRCWT